MDFRVIMFKTKETLKQHGKQLHVLPDLWFLCISTTHGGHFSSIRNSHASLALQRNIFLLLKYPQLHPCITFLCTASLQPSFFPLQCFGDACCGLKLKVTVFSQTFVSECRTQPHCPRQDWSTRCLLWSLSRANALHHVLNPPGVSIGRCHLASGISEMFILRFYAFIM